MRNDAWEGFHVTQGSKISCPPRGGLVGGEGGMVFRQITVNVFLHIVYVYGMHEHMHMYQTICVCVCNTCALQESKLKMCVDACSHVHVL